MVTMSSSTIEAVALLETIQRQIRKNEFSVRNCSLVKTNDRPGGGGMRLVLDFAIEPERTNTYTTRQGATEYVMPGLLADALKQPKPQPLQPFGSRDLDID